MATNITESGDSQRPHPISLDELTALCDEMVSLSRAGVPLDRGLLQLADDLPKRMSAHARQVGERLQAGQSLADVVADDDTAFPPVYKSVVEAGLRSGRLTVALEGFARLARQLSEVRRLVISSLVYPTLLLVLVLFISAQLISRFGPMIAGGLLSIKGPGSESDWAAGTLRSYALWSEWFWLVPASLLAVAVTWMMVTLAARGAGFASWIPGVSRLLRNSRLMAFTEVLALLVRQQVPLHQAVQLAGAASGDRHLKRDANQLAEQLESGRALDSQTGVFESSKSNKRGIPPFIRWNLLNSGREGQLESMLDRARQTYSRRTEVEAIWLRRTLPIILSAILGGTVAVMYAGTVFYPWYTMLHSLADAMETM